MKESHTTAISGPPGHVVLTLFLAASMAWGQQLDDRTLKQVEELKRQRQEQLNQVKEIYLRELRKLETASATAGNSEAVSLVRKKLVEARENPGFRTLCRIRLVHDPVAPVRKLREGAARFAGAWEGANFSRVAEELENADFLPCERAASTEIRGVVQEDGYLYVMGKDARIEVGGKPPQPEQVYRKIEGSGLTHESVVRVLVFEGDTFTVSGLEAGVVAAAIGR